MGRRDCGNASGAPYAAEQAEAIGTLLAEDENPRKMEPAHYVLGMSALNAGDNAAAAEHLRQADHANNIFVRYQLALAEEALGNTEVANKLFDEVASFNFNSVGFALVGRDAGSRAAS